MSLCEGQSAASRSPHHERKKTALAGGYRNGERMGRIPKRLKEELNYD